MTKEFAAQKCSSHVEDVENGFVMVSSGSVQLEGSVAEVVGHGFDGVVQR